MASKENDVVIPMTQASKVRKPKLSTVNRIISLNVPQDQSSIVAKSNGNPCSHLVSIRPPRSRPHITLNVKVLLAAEKFIKEAAQEAERFRQSNSSIRLGDDVLRCIPVLEFVRNGDPSTRCFVDAEALSRGVSYVTLVEQAAAL